MKHQKIDRRHFPSPHQGAKSKKAKPEPRPRRVGRPTDYREGYADLAKELRMLGLSVRQIAHLFNKTVASVEAWRTMFPEFGKAWDEGGEYADAHVAKALYHRAIGYSHIAEKISYDSKTGEFARTNYVEQFPPDTGAATTWLAARQPKLWMNKTQQQHTGADGEPLIPPTIIINPVMVQRPIDVKVIPDSED